MPADRREVHHTLTHREKLRFLCDDKRDHYVYTLVLSGYQFGWTKVSRGSAYRVIDDTLLGKIARQVHLQTSELKAALDCTLNWPDYALILRRGFPSEEHKIPLV